LIYKFVTAEPLLMASKSKEIGCQTLTL